MTYVTPSTEATRELVGHSDKEERHLETMRLIRIHDALKKMVDAVIERDGYVAVHRYSYGEPLPLPEEKCTSFYDLAAALGLEKSEASFPRRSEPVLEAFVPAGFSYRKGHDGEPKTRYLDAEAFSNSWKATVRRSFFERLRTILGDDFKFATGKREGKTPRSVDDICSVPQSLREKRRQLASRDEAETDEIKRICLREHSGARNELKNIIAAICEDRGIDFDGVRMRTGMWIAALKTELELSDSDARELVDVALGIQSGPRRLSFFDGELPPRGHRQEQATESEGPSTSRLLSPPGRMERQREIVDEVTTGIAKSAAEMGSKPALGKFLRVDERGRVNLGEGTPDLSQEPSDPVTEKTPDPLVTERQLGN